VDLWHFGKKVASLGFFRSGAISRKSCTSGAGISE
jgi:hypothetical protein